MRILGISAFYHDSAVVIIEDGKILCALEEERMTRIKHDNAFPLLATQKCLESLGLSIDDIDAIAYYEKPLKKFERILETFVLTYPKSFLPFTKGIPEWLGEKIKVESIIRKKLKYKKRVYFIPHHASHAAAAYYTSPFNYAAVLTIDGVGEEHTTGLWVGKENSLKLLKTLHFPNSLGLLYSTFTAFLGFKVNDDEYKVMGLAAYGKPVFKEAIYKLLDVKDDGSFRLKMDYFSFREEFKMWNKKFEGIFGEPRKKTDQVMVRHKNIAASIQEVTEELIFGILGYLQKETKLESVCVGGGVGLNALANGKITEKTPFQKTSIFGPAGDSGGAIGAALFLYHHILGNPKINKQTSLSIGTQYSDEEIVQVLEKYSGKILYQKFETGRILDKTVEKLAHGKIIGWFQGRMEFGPRALGNRSILASPLKKEMKERVNIVKKREQFRPFAGSVLVRNSELLFNFPKGKDKEWPYMNYCFHAHEKGKKMIPAIVHEDGTTRIQTVGVENGIYYDLISDFFKKTGVPCILNTSFNVKGEPIVENPDQAVGDLLTTKMDYLVIGNYFVSKKI